MKAYLKDVGTRVLVRVLTKLVLAAIGAGIALATGITPGF